MKEDDKTVLGVELDETHLVAEVLDNHPGLGLFRLASQGICSELWRPSLEEEMSEGGYKLKTSTINSIKNIKVDMYQHQDQVKEPPEVHAKVVEEQGSMIGRRLLRRPHGCRL